MCDGCGCQALEQGDDAVPGLCLLVPHLLPGLVRDAPLGTGSPTPHLLF